MNFFVYPDLMMRIHLYNSVDVHYVDLVLKSPMSRDYFSEAAIGTSESMPKINQHTVKRTWVPLPPAKEQQRIVDRVNVLMSAINENAEMEDRLVSLKEAFPGNFRDAVLQAAVLGQLTERADGEESARLIDKILKTKKQLLSEKTISRDNSCKTQPFDPADNDLPEIPSN